MEFRLICAQNLSDVSNKIYLINQLIELGYFIREIFFSLRLSFISFFWETLSANKA